MGRYHRVLGGLGTYCLIFEFLLSLNFWPLKISLYISQVWQWVKRGSSWPYTLFPNCSSLLLSFLSLGISRMWFCFSALLLAVWSCKIAIPLHVHVAGSSMFMKFWLQFHSTREVFPDALIWRKLPAVDSLYHIILFYFFITFTSGRSYLVYSNVYCPIPNAEGFKSH